MNRYFVMSLGLCVLAVALHREPPSPAHAAARVGADDGEGRVPESTAKTRNRVPTIAGTADKSVLQGARYSFQPVAADADGDAVTFNAVNRPAWATFDAATGRLEGTPGLGDVGTFAGVVIGVSDGHSSAKLEPLSIKVRGTAPRWARLTWDPATSATASQAAKVRGFKVYWGTKPGRYASSATIMDPSATAYVVESLTPNTYHFVVKSINSKGDESVYSQPRSLTIP
jgi:Putative Ig domain